MIAGHAALILCHKQKTSARTRFLRFPDTLLVVGALPAPAGLLADFGSVRPHPAAAIAAALQRLGLATGSIEPVVDFHADVETPIGIVPVLLGGLTTIDPPFDAADAAGGRFVSILEASPLPPVELELLRRAYEVLIG
ncbi:MAG TPA: hypothetical protein VF816_18010 [Rhodocyclaceae bacterium]